MGNKIIVEFDKAKYESKVCSKCGKRKSCTQTTLRVFICGYKKHQLFKELDYKEQNNGNKGTVRKICNSIIER